jgi:hypothetical protein
MQEWEVPTIIKIRTNGRFCDATCSQRVYNKMSCRYECRHYKFVHLKYNVDELACVRCEECLELGRWRSL